VARKKKPVDRTPICDPAYLRRIDPVWMPGPVPPCFWQGRAHRRDYLLWFSDRVGLRTMEDLYQLELSVCFSGLHQLQVLSLWDTEITGVGVKHLAELAQLRELNLFGTQGTEAGQGTEVGLENLIRLKQLRKVELQVTEEVAKEFQKASRIASFVVETVCSWLSIACDRTEGFTWAAHFWDNPQSGGSIENSLKENRMIRFACPQCNSTFNVEDKAAGKKTECAKCGTAFSVPSPTASKPSAPRPVTVNTAGLLDGLPPLPAANTFGLLDELPPLPADPFSSNLMSASGPSPAPTPHSLPTRKDTSSWRAPMRSIGRGWAFGPNTGPGAPSRAPGSREGRTTSGSCG